MEGRETPEWPSLCISHLRLEKEQLFRSFLNAAKRDVHRKENGYNVVSDPTNRNSSTWLLSFFLSFKPFAAQSLSSFDRRTKTSSKSLVGSKLPLDSVACFNMFPSSTGVGIQAKYKLQADNLRVAWLDWQFVCRGNNQMTVQEDMNVGYDIQPSRCVNCGSYIETAGVDRPCSKQSLQITKNGENIRLSIISS